MDVSIALLLHSRCPVDSMRDAVLTVSPNKQYLGIFTPTTPAAHEPATHNSNNNNNKPIFPSTAPPQEDICVWGAGVGGLREDASSTGVHADADPHRDAWQVSQLEGSHEVQDVQRHAADIHRMSVSISLGKSRGHHVGVPNGLHLSGDGRHGDAAPPPASRRPAVWHKNALHGPRVGQIITPCRRRGGPRCCRSLCRCR